MRVSIWSFFRLAALLAGSTALAPSAWAQVIGGSVLPTNSLTVSHVSNLSVVADVGQTDTTVATGTIDNNSALGWRLTVASANNGKLVRGAGGTGSEIPYTQIKFVKTGGTLGTGLTDPNGTSKNIATTGSVFFNTATKTATSATVGYAFALKISWSGDARLLEGTYGDTLTVTLANDI